jgi:hypothetical protein
MTSVSVAGIAVPHVRTQMGIGTRRLGVVVPVAACIAVAAWASTPRCCSLCVAAWACALRTATVRARRRASAPAAAGASTSSGIAAAA